MLPTVTYAYFASIFPELASTPSAVVDALSPLACNYVGENVYGSTVNNSATAMFAVALWIAHFVTLGAQKGLGPVTADHIGQLSTSNAALSTEDDMKMTSYGMRLWSLGRSLAPGGVFTGGSPNGGLVPPFGGFQPTWTGPGESWPW